MLTHPRSGTVALSDDEIVHTAAMVLLQAHETTKNLLGNGMLALLRHPGVLARLRADPPLIAAAVPELARYDGPLQFVTRVARRDTTLDGVAIRAGQLVVALLASANRDPRVFVAPDELRLERRPVPLADSGLDDPPPGRTARRPALSFGIGHHLCVGRHLAHREVEIALAARLQHWPSIEPAVDRPDYLNILSFRSLAALPLRVAAGGLR